MTIRKIAPKKVEQGFKLVEDRLEINRLLEQAALTLADAYVRLADQPEGVKIKAQVREPASYSDGVRLSPSEAMPDEIADALEKPDPEHPTECLAVLFLKGESLLGVRSRNVVFEGGLIKLRPPCRHFVMQRRKEARYQIPRGYEYYINMPAIEGSERTVTKRLIDISASGLSFQVISPREAELFVAGKLIRGIEIKLRADTIVHVDAEVCNQVPAPADLRIGGTKIGCKVVSISPADSTSLVSFVAARLAGL